MEVFVPSTGQHCQLPDLPGDPRYAHTMEEMTVCGGGYNDSTTTSCLTLIDGAWQTTTTLLEQRSYSEIINMTHDTHYLFASLILTIRRDHSSWASPSGAMLLGGLYSKNTSERIQEDGTSVSGFPLDYDL